MLVLLQKSGLWRRISSNGKGECDDGNTSDTDACLASCRVARCGDGKTLVGVEACDDGNSDNGDDCLTDCRIPFCGDGFVRKNGPYAEECDDGDDINENTCLNSCRRNVCGDGVPGGAGEECDDGNTADSDGCSSKCKLGSCGDGKVDSNEECDDGNSDMTDACVNCKAAKCGDGYLWDGHEECERGNDLLSPLCKDVLPELELHNPETRAQCSAKCEVDSGSCSYCGDGVVHPLFGEVCDGPVGCFELTLFFEVYPDPSKVVECDSHCKDPEWEKCPRCGDSILQEEWEECDDGNSEPDDGCDQCLLTGESRLNDSTIFAR